MSPQGKLKNSTIKIDLLSSFIGPNNHTMSCSTRPTDDLIKCPNFTFEPIAKPNFQRPSN